MRPPKRMCERCEAVRRTGHRRPKCQCAVDGQRQRRAIQRQLRRTVIAIEEFIESRGALEETQCWREWKLAEVKLREARIGYEEWAYPYSLNHSFEQDLTELQRAAVRRGSFVAPRTVGPNGERIGPKRRYPFWRSDAAYGLWFAEACRQQEQIVNGVSDA
jgi:hypothetical protein